MGQKLAFQIMGYNGNNINSHVHIVSKVKKPKKNPALLKLSAIEANALIDTIVQSDLPDDTAQLIKQIINSHEWFVNQLEQGLLNITKLKKLFEIQGSEKAVNRNPYHSANKKPGTDKRSDKPIKGHGRNAADAYKGAKIENVPHPELSPGDTCPGEACDGRLYEMSDPGVVLRVAGSQLASATRYNQQKLRCAVCEAIYTAPLPPEAGDKKYDENFAAMLMINKYFMSVPFYRQDRLQTYLGIPLPSSTQWDIMYAYKPALKALYDALLQDAANGIGICYDDTSVTILESVKAKKLAELGEKKKHNCFTTGVVSVHEDYRIYLYMSDDRTAGRVAKDILQIRDKSLPPPLLMCDAIAANIPPEVSKDLYILCYCLVHARRQFYELPEGYDDLADTVIRLIGKIYDHEHDSKKMEADARLAHHKEHSAPVMQELKQFLSAQQDQFEPNSVPGKAIAYILDRFTELSQFLKHPNAPLDTNIVERALKLVIQTRKSSMFYKSLSSAEFASQVQSALYSAAQNDVNPHQYMSAILKHQASVIENPKDWFPWCYQETLKQIQAAGAKIDP